MTDLPDLSRTAAAIEAHDAHEATQPETDAPNKAWFEWEKELQRLAREVGVAYGLDTDDRNNEKDCAELIRPGPKQPPTGAGQSFVRRMVADWQEHNA